MKYLLLECKKYKWDRERIYKPLSQKLQIPIRELNLNILLATQDGIKYTIEYIKETIIATRKWILGQLDDETQYDGGWDDII